MRETWLGLMRADLRSARRASRAGTTAGDERDGHALTGNSARDARAERDDLTRELVPRHVR